MELNKYSKTITQDETQPLRNSYGTGLTDRFEKAQVGGDMDTTETPATCI
jgi:hypothetical protein